MKKLVTLAVVVAAALVAFNYFTTGEIRLIPESSSATPAEEGPSLNRLKGDFRRATQAYRQAGRAAATSGMDTTAEAAQALAEVERVQRQVEAFVKDATSDEERTAGRALAAEISDWLATVRG